MNKIRIVIVCLLVIALTIGGVALFLKLKTASYPVEIVLPPASQQIEVYVSGEVQIPGIYSIAETSRVEDAVAVAGGFSANADQSALNMARTLRDGAEVYVPRTGQSSQRININTAEIWLLDALDGIGPSLAQDIVEYRAEHGPFDSIDDLKNVKGIGPATIEKIKDKITVR